MSQDSCVLSAEQISVGYRNNLVLNGLCLSVRRGEIMGIAGVSGAGKSTLLNALVGLVEPWHGRVCYSTALFGEHKARMLELPKCRQRLKNYLGYSTQDPSFFDELSVQENLDYFGAMYGVPRHICRKNSSTLLGLLELTGCEKKLAGSLSGGMRKRLDMCCALIHNPPLLLLDEPTSDLDPLLRARVWEIVKRVNIQGTTVIVSSHFLNEIEELCHRIAILHKGVILKIVPNTHSHKGRAQWFEVELYESMAEQLAGLLLKSATLKPEDISQDNPNTLLLCIREDSEKRAVQEAVRELGARIKHFSPWTHSLDEVFREVVR